MHIACDIDGCLADLVGALVVEVNRGLLPGFRYEQVVHFTIEDNFPPDKRAAAAGLCRRLEGEGDFLETLPPLPGARETLGALADEGHRIDLVTARGTDPLFQRRQISRIQRQTRLWVARLKLPVDRLEFVAHEQKSAALAGYDVYIEDRWENAAQAAQAHPRLAVMLIDQPWNAGNGPYANLLRVSGWPRILMEVRRLSGDKA